MILHMLFTVYQKRADPFPEVQMIDHFASVGLPDCAVSAVPCRNSEIVQSAVWIQAATSPWIARLCPEDQYTLFGV